eukprot:jgi/Undpi1/11829/HiC_scaffold_4.g01528.m1
MMVPRGALACCWYALIFAIACCIMDTAKAFVALHRPKNNDDNDHRWITPSKEKRVPARQGIRLRTGRSLLLSGEKHATKALARSPVVPSPREQHPERTPSKGGEVCPLRLSDDVFHTLQVCHPGGTDSVAQSTKSKQQLDESAPAEGEEPGLVETVMTADMVRKEERGAGREEQEDNMEVGEREQVEGKGEGDMAWGSSGQPGFFHGSDNFSRVKSGQDDPARSYPTREI